MSNRPNTRSRSTSDPPTSDEPQPWVLSANFERDLRRRIAAQAMLRTPERAGDEGNQGEENNQEGEVGQVERAEAPTPRVAGLVNPPRTSTEVNNPGTSREVNIPSNSRGGANSEEVAPPPEGINNYEALNLIVAVHNDPDQQNFMHRYKHAYSSIKHLIMLIKKLESSETPRVIIQMITHDVEDLQKKMTDLQLLVYSFSETIQSVEQADRPDQQIALDLTAELVESFDKIRETALKKREDYEGTPGGSSGLKPPKQSIPKFTGNHAEWPAFKTNFINLVRTLPGVDKLRLLNDAVKGHDAQDCVKDLAFTDGNWTIAWTRITSRYDSPREIAHAALRPLLEFPALHQQTEAGLHKLIGTVRTTMAQLRQIKLGSVSEAEVLYLHLIMGRLDAKTISEFTRTLTSSDVPSLDTCVAFLEKRAKDVALVREIKQNVNTSASRNSNPQGGKNGARGKGHEIVLPLNPRVAQPKGRPPQSKSQVSQRRPPTSPGNGQPPRPPCPFCSQHGHRYHTCPKYQAMELTQKRQAVQQARLCFSCLSPSHTSKNCTSKFLCLVCNKAHHTSLHNPTQPRQAAAQPMGALSPVAVQAEPSGLVPTARIRLEANGLTTQVRALLDTGAAGCFITSAAASKLNLQPDKKGQVFAMANGQKVTSTGTVPLKVAALYPRTFTIHVQAHVMPVLLSSNVPAQHFDTRAWDHLKNADLADPFFNRPAPIDFIFGLPVLDELMQDGRIPGKPGQATAYKTRLGHVIMGSRPDPGILAPVTELTSPSTEEVNFDLQRFWNVDSLQASEKAFLTPEEQFCEDHFVANTIRLESGRYQVKWPFLQSPTKLGHSFSAAMKRWLAVERKLLQTPGRHAEYIKQLQEYLDYNQMEVVPEEEIHKVPSYYMPHHAVMKPSSTTTKLRVVFDASAKTTSGLSLNSLLPPGPSIQPDLFRQSLHFREDPVAMKADVKEMFRQIQIDPIDRDMFRILWRKSPSHPILHYRLLVVSFGSTTSTFIACRVLKQLATDEKLRYPIASPILHKRFYIDDLGTSVMTVDKAQDLYQELMKLLQAGGFSLRKWATNSMELLKSIPEDQRETAPLVDMDDTATIKTLGISWSPRSDSYTFTCNPDMLRTHTKRNILSETSKIFDPLGLISPVTVKAKILMQEIWKCGVGWDDQLPTTISKEWNLLSEALTSLDLHPIPRPLRLTSTGKWELHGFADASESAYAAVVYIRSILPDQRQTNLIASKTRVAPLKPLFTIPRLELQAAVLLVDLVSVIKETISIPIDRVYYWTDSAIVLHWIQGSPQRWKLFIRNRVAAIQEQTAPEDWAHVVSAENPADCASRGLLPTEIKNFTLWWKGPTWLMDMEIIQPPIPGMPAGVDTEASTATPAVAVISPNVSFIDCLTRIGPWSRILRVLTRIMAVARLRSFDTSKPIPSDLTKAEIALVRLIQQATFPELLQPPRKKLPWKGLKALRPFVDEDGTLRIGGRLHFAEAPYNTRHPMILPGHEIVRTLIMETHIALLHAGKRVILNHLRQQFWLLNGTKHIKSTIDKCLTCFRYHAQPHTQLMGQLPSARTSLVRPFAHTGVDFAGPYQLKNFTGRGGHFKVWICLFTCMATRAIHLEIVSSLSAEGFLNALRRFVSRRGKPSHMHSDNGTNFVGANHHLEDHLDHFRSAFEKSGQSAFGLDLNKIHWAFSPPSGPHHGGAWEVCVRLVKHHLRTQLKDTVQTWEQFETLLICIEAIVNSRPITPMDDDPESLEVLTPGHFLVGSSLTAIPEADLGHIRYNRLSQYQLLTRQFQDLWKRWNMEYLQELQRTHKWHEEKPNLHVGDMVLLMDDQAPPLKWKTGRIKKVHAGPDKLVRVVTAEVATSKSSDPKDYSVYKKEVVRPITKLARLPLDRSTATVGPGLNLIRPHTRVPVAAWIATAVLLSLLQPATAQPPTTLSVPTSTFIAITAGIIAVMGTLMNGYAILHILHQTITSKTKKAYRLCALSLCISDCIIAAYLVPIAAVRYYFRTWIFSIELCRISCLILYGTVTWTLFNLVFIAAFRYWKVKATLPAPGEHTSTILSIAVLIMCSSYVLPYLAFLNLWGTIGPRPTDTSFCTILPDSEDRTPKPWIWILGVFTPLLTIYIASVVLYFRVHRRKGPVSTNSKRALSRLRYTFLQVLGSFMIGYQPILLLNFLDNEKKHLPVSLHIGSMILAWLTTIIHPIVYLFRPRLQRKESLSSGPRMRADTMSSAKERTLPTGTLREIRTPAIRQARMQKVIAIFTMLITCQCPTTTNGEQIALHPVNQHKAVESLLEQDHETPAGIPAAVFELTTCNGLEAPMSQVPECLSSAYWIGVLPDASACVHMKTCDGRVVSSDGLSCNPIPPTCTNVTSAVIDQITCQTRDVPEVGSPPHIVLKDAQVDYCAVGSLRLRNCLHFKEAIQTVPVLIIKGLLYPVTDLHITEDAALQDVNSYDCTCQNSICTTGTCHGDTTFCKHVGCTTDLSKHPTSCYCKYTNQQMLHVYNSQGGRVIPDCWGHLSMVVKVAAPSVDLPPKCKGCWTKCLNTGIELHTPNQIPKYVKVTKNPGYVTIMPSTSTTLIPMTTHMLVAHGTTHLEVWLPEADTPYLMEQTCPRLNVCQVITCKMCYDRWINVACYDFVNWCIIGLIIGIITLIILIIRPVIRCLNSILRTLSWPFRKLWSWRKATVRPQQQVDEENGTPLLPMDSPHPYAHATVTRIRPARTTGFVYRGPLALILALCLLSSTTYGCSEFASMAASSTECRHDGNVETCHLQINTRLAVSPIGQKSCFKISNMQQTTLGTIEFETNSISVICSKQILYYVPRAKATCQSHIQCYSLYSSSNCHGEKCSNFGPRDTVGALNSTKDALGWSTCLAQRYPTCPWWLTRDCHFMRTAFINPSQEAYEVFECPSWEFAVTLNVTTHLGNQTTTQIATLQVGEKQLVPPFNVSLISTSIPPVPELGQCLLRRGNRVAIVPCNERGENGIGRLGEIQCDSPEAAQAIDQSCRAQQSLITTQVDSTGVRCSADLIDPELLLKDYLLPLKLDDGVITARNETIIFDTSHSTLLEMQITSADLVLTAEQQNGKCEATFIKIEGCYSCLSGAVLFIQAKTDSESSITATLECPNGLIYTQFVVTKKRTTFKQIVPINLPEVDITCSLKCPANNVAIQVKGHLHYLSDPNFQQHSEMVSHHSAISGGLDFNWISFLGSSISSWIFRGTMIAGIILITFLIIFLTCQFTHYKQA